jgi:hypothetical protein
VWRQILSSLVVCFFARNIYDRDTILPKRILEIDSPHGKVQEGYLKEAVEEFYRLLASD